jgi:hypothetical protein
MAGIGWSNSNLSGATLQGNTLPIIDRCILQGIHYKECVAKGGGRGICVGSDSWFSAIG